MKSKNLGYLITTIIGIFMIVLGTMYYENHLFIRVFGLALTGISIELYFKMKKDTVTKNGISRNDIDMKDERTILVNAKAGETLEYVMCFATFIAFVVAHLLNVSRVGTDIILSLIILRLILNSIIKKYYESHV
ncbi:hypothetical protein KTC96_23230 (plasmid) [Clostridium estertheticum]|uniref:hypothetical protein n=1 Tax=Clostridium estertheticum TaxID=238834 RepID=UPI001C7CF697|nr:hypothetical protein [Clostridium estertheticum]MBX4262775.1 hypothetical protein [Clostridium estertheticum]WLC72810.1 hypothetical protein KTC96_23230 [Clostridium estertheticum]